MAKLCLKKQSKRIPARRRYKIEKRVRQHNKKKRREEKKTNKASKINKKIVIPNVCPFKDEILKEADTRKQKEKELLLQRYKKIAAKKAAEENEDDDEEMEDEQDEAGNLTNLLENAQARQDEHDVLLGSDEESDQDGTSSKAESSLKAYFKEFKKVVEAADVILEVVDARDPLGTRCKQVEEIVRDSTGNKRLVLVLNKADLIPKESLTKWLNYLRRSVPAIAFKASTQQQKRNLSRKKVKKWSSKEVSVSPCVGAEVLMSLLGNYCRNKGIKTAIHVGVVGLPNVGKSSIINSLKRSRACDVGSMPGVTKNAKVVELDKKIKLLDSPGIVFANPTQTNSESDAATVLKNAVHVNSISDPIVPASAILQRANKHQLMQLYNLPEFSTPQEFFVSFAESTGKFKRGGVPDAEKAARQLIEDWNKGKIKYYTVPPEDDSQSHVGASIVQQVAAEFDFDSFKEMEAESLEKFEEEMKESKFKNISPSVVESSDSVNAAVVQMEEDEEAKDDLISDNVTVVAQKRKPKNSEKQESAKAVKKQKTMMELEGNQKLNLNQKVAFKKLKKTRTRNSRHASNLADVLEKFSLGPEANDNDDKYDFNTDFKL